MADVWIQVMTRTEADRARLGVDVRRKMAAEDAVGCETLIAREPDHADLRNDAARLYLELGQPQRALTPFRGGRAALQPQSAVARYNVGVTLEALGRTADAAREYEAAVRSTRRIRSRTTIWAACASRRGVSTRRARTTSARSRSGPANAEARNNLGAVLLAFGEAAASIPHLLEAIRLRPVYAEAHFNLGRAYASAGRFAEAIGEATIAEAQAVAAGKTTLATQVREQLAVYRAALKR